MAVKLAGSVDDTADSATGAYNIQNKIISIHCMGLTIICWGVLIPIKINFSQILKIDFGLFHL